MGQLEGRLNAAVLKCTPVHLDKSHQVPRRCAQMELPRLSSIRPDLFCEQTVSKILFAHVIAHIFLMFAGAPSEFDSQPALPAGSG